MAFSQADIDQLRAAIATGALQVRYADGSMVTYRSLREMQDTLRMMQADVSPAAGCTPSRSFVAGF